MTWRWPSTAETCHCQPNKYDTTTVVFWQTPPQFSTSHISSWCGFY